MMNPILVYASIAVATAGFAGGWAVRSWKADAALSKSYERLIAEKDRMQTKVDAASAKYEELLAANEPARIETRNTIREIYKDVEVPSQCAAAPALVGVLEGVRQRANAATTGQLSAKLPTAPKAPGAAD